MTINALMNGGQDGAPFAGIELGGTKCVCTLAVAPDRIVDRHIVPTTHPDETLPALIATLREWQQTHGFQALGIASFGPVDLDRNSSTYGHILATNKPGWAGADVLETLSAPFDVPVALDTDVNGAALAELAWGSGQGLDSFAYATIGTGIGVGVVANGRPLTGFAHGEWGHVRVPRLAGDTQSSVCRFHDDCVEGLASGTALLARLDGRDMATLAPDDVLWEPVVHYIACMAHALVSGAAPRRIAIGGGVPTAQPHLIPRIEQALRASINGYMPLPDAPYVTLPQLGNLAGPLGSIAVAQLAVIEK